MKRATRGTQLRALAHAVGLPAAFSTYPERTLRALDPPEIKMIAAEAIKDVASEFLDQEYKREFGELG